jgi:hypothetical protein
MPFSKIVLNTVLGSFVVVGGLVILLGPSAAGTLFFFSVVCTLGIGGVFWVALAFGMGWIMTTLWQAIRGHHAPTQPESSPQMDALTTYVSRALQAGANDDQLQRRLQRQGWAEEEIAQAIQRVQDNPDMPHAPGAV